MMKKITETELSVVAGGRASRKLIVKKIGPVRQVNKFDVTQVLSDLAVGGDLDVSAAAAQSNDNSGTVS